MAVIRKKRAMKKINAATKIQSAFKGHLVRCSDELARVLAVRTCLCDAACLIQKAYRGYRCRKNFRRLKHLASELIRIKAASKIQSFFRVIHGRSKIREIHQERVQASIVITRFCVQWFQPWHEQQLAMMFYNLTCIIKIQCRIRRFLARKRRKDILHAQHHYFRGFGWLIVHIVLLLLFIMATTSERGDGFFSSGGAYLGKHLFDLPSPCPPCSPAQLSPHLIRPQQLWSWLEQSFMPRYQQFGVSRGCTVAEANARNCSLPNAAPWYIAAPLVVLQKRIRLARIPLPYAHTQPIPAPCAASWALLGGLCPLQPLAVGLPPTSSGNLSNHSASSNSPASTPGPQASAGNGSHAAADATQQSYPRGPGELLVAADHAGEDRLTFGSAALNFSFSDDQQVALVSGRLAGYSGGGFRLSACSASGACGFNDSRATGCGLPCEFGLRRAELGGWLDGGSRAVLAQAALWNLQKNTLATASWVAEALPSGLLRVSGVVQAGRLQAYEQAGDSPGHEPDAVARYRLNVELVLAVAALGLLGAACLGCSWHLRLVKSARSGRRRLQLRRQPGTRWQRLGRTLSSHTGADLAAAGLAVLAVLLRLGRQDSGRDLVAGFLGPAAGPASLDQLAWHAAQLRAADGCMGLAAGLVWARLLATRMREAPVVAELLVAAARLAAPLLAWAAVCLHWVAAVASVAALSAGPPDQGWAGFRASLASAVDWVGEGLAPQDDGPGRAPGAQRYGVSAPARTGRYQPAGPQMLLGLGRGLCGLAACLAAAAATLALGEARAAEEDRRGRPWLYRCVRMEAYRRWQVRVAWGMVVKALEESRLIRLELDGVTDEEPWMGSQMRSLDHDMHRAACHDMHTRGLGCPWVGRPSASSAFGRAPWRSDALLLAGSFRSWWRRCGSHRGWCSGWWEAGWLRPASCGLGC